MMVLRSSVFWVSARSLAGQRSAPHLAGGAVTITDGERCLSKHCSPLTPGAVAARPCSSPVGVERAAGRDAVPASTDAVMTSLGGSLRAPLRIIPTLSPVAWPIRHTAYADTTVVRSSTQYSVSWRISVSQREDRDAPSGLTRGHLARAADAGAGLIFKLAFRIGAAASHPAGYVPAASASLCCIVASVRSTAAAAP